MPSPGSSIPPYCVAPTHPRNESDGKVQPDQLTPKNMDIPRASFVANRSARTPAGQGRELELQVATASLFVRDAYIRSESRQ